MEPVFEDMKKYYKAPEAYYCSLNLLFMLAQSGNNIDPATEDQWGTL